MLSGGNVEKLNFTGNLDFSCSCSERLYAILGAIGRFVEWDNFRAAISWYEWSSIVKET
jgi:hypothetical protein